MLRWVVALALALSCEPVFEPAVPCDGPEVACDGGCVDPQRDSRNCGACGVACGAESLCVEGRCRSLCGVGEQRCADACVNPLTDARHCGRCDNRCEGAQVCTEGRCGEAPQWSYCEGARVDLRRNPAHCGRCARACTTGAVCERSTCVCQDGLAECGGQCVDLLTSPENCGACGRACDPTQQCTGGVCACSPGETSCGGVCVSLMESRAHCGACGRACRADEVCTSGACACRPGERPCGNVCADLLRSASHCGACGRACTGGAQCFAGVCACPTGLVECDGQCVNLAFSDANCGGCGRRCEASRRCVWSRCECASGMNCGGQCVDLDADAAHCGACGLACAAGEQCVSGRCMGEMPQLVRPLSGLPVAEGLLFFGWKAVPGVDAIHELCADPRCANRLWYREVQGTIYTPPEPLAPGTYYWRLWPRRGAQLGARPSVTWRFTVVRGAVSLSVAPGSVLYDLDGWSGEALVGTTCDGGTGRDARGSRPPYFETIGDEDGDGFLDARRHDGYTITSCTTGNLILGTRISRHRGSSAGLVQVGIDVHDEWAAWFNLRWVVEGVEDFNGDGHADFIEFRDMDWRRFNDIRFGGRPGNSLSICGFTPADRARSLGDIDGDLAGEFACITDGATRLYRFHQSMVIPVAVPRCDAVGAEPLGVDLAYRGVSAVDANGDRFVDVAARARMADGSERDVVWFGGVGGLRGDRCALR